MRGKGIILAGIKHKRNKISNNRLFPNQFENFHPIALSKLQHEYLVGIASLWARAAYRIASFAKNKMAYKVKFVNNGPQALPVTILEGDLTFRSVVISLSQVQIISFG